MLSELIIENFILVKRAVFSFDLGLTVITGATGAGKSLFIKALKLILGGRADKTVVRPGSKQAAIQALFEIPEQLAETLGDSGIETEGELVVRRIIQAEGKGRIFINGVMVTLSQLRQLAPSLASISSQHEFQYLLNKERHLEMLDDFAGLHQERRGLFNLYREAQGIRRSLEELRKQYSRREEERENILKEQQLIDEINPREDEEEELERERKVLKASSRLRELGEDIYGRLYGARGSITEELSLCRASMEKMTELDPSLQAIKELLEAVSFQADDLAISLRDYIQALPMDLSRLEQVEERLFRLQGLRRKFGPEITDVLAHRLTLEERLKAFENLEQEMDILVKRLQKADDKLCRLASDLSRKRQRQASEMEKAVKEELGQLDLSRAEFKVDIKTPDGVKAEDIGPAGADQVEFLFSANPGQPPAPLAKVASGGELSRILLALKTVSGEKDHGDTLIFDEIDAGLGGEIAENVGRKLRKMAETYQVIAITHFPQIAALGTTHLAVEKIQAEGETVTMVRSLSGDERLDEIVRMLGGETDTARRYARELLSPVFRRT